MVRMFALTRPFAPFPSFLSPSSPAAPLGELKLCFVREIRDLWITLRLLTKGQPLLKIWREENAIGSMFSIHAIAVEPMVSKYNSYSFFWAPPGGESLANVCIRIDHTLNTLRRDCANQRVVIVCHGEGPLVFY